MDLLQETRKQYCGLFGAEPEIIVCAPGRVNLIGEHTDYNGGYVLPVAINRMIVMAAGLRSDRELHLHAPDRGGAVVKDLSNLRHDPVALWSNYVQGVADCLGRRGFFLGGGNFCFRGDIPIGSGLSSSAALEVASAVAFLKLNSIELKNSEIISIAREAEQDFVGVRCGIMDQFIAVMGKQDHAQFLDCRDLSSSAVHLPVGMNIIVCDNGVRRALASTGYNRRREECEEALTILSGIFPKVSSFRDLSVSSLKEVKSRLEPVLFRRVRHILSENERVLTCVEALRAGDLNRVGELLYESHRSLSDDFEVSTEELDALIEIARTIDGVYGARMTGAGFGGCAICIVADDMLDVRLEKLKNGYQRLRKRPLSTYVTHSERGAYYFLPGKSLLPISVAQ